GRGGVAVAERNAQQFADDVVAFVELHRSRIVTIWRPIERFFRCRITSVRGAGGITEAAFGEGLPHQALICAASVYAISQQNRITCVSEGGCDGCEFQGVNHELQTLALAILEAVFFDEQRAYLQQRVAPD